LIDRLGGPAGVPAADAGVVERLGRWLHWTDAVALSAVLDAPVASGRDDATGSTAEAERAEAELRRLRQRLKADIEAAVTGDEADEAADLPAVRHRSLQQAMAAALEPVRERLRRRLASASPALAELAALDEAMARALAERERTLLPRVTRLLPRSLPRDERVAVLLAELDLRLAPLHGLVAAWRQPASPDAR
jgi:hypothetical protein